MTVDTLNKDEIWRTIKGWGWYEVSSCGRIRSKTIKYTKKESTKAGRRFSCNRKGRMLKTKCRRRYSVVTLCGPNGKRKQFMVHQLVVWNFIGRPPLGFQCCHNDGNTMNNNLRNLRYDTPKNNTADKYKHGTMPEGSTHWNARLTPAKVRQIRQNKKSITVLAKEFNVSKSAVWAVRKFKTWIHI